jgi:hypothetical protein
MHPSAKHLIAGQARGWRLVSLAALLAVSACAAAPPPGPPAPQAFLNREVAVALPSPATLGHSWHASQLLNADYGGQKGQIPVELEVLGGRLTLVGLAGVGPPLFTIRFDGREILSEHKTLGAKLLPPEQILADVMLVYWPRSAWLPRLPPGWRLTDEGQYRRLFDATGTLVVEIHTVGDVDQPHTVELDNVTFNYHLKIVTYASDRR